MLCLSFIFGKVCVVSRFLGPMFSLPFLLKVYETLQQTKCLRFDVLIYINHWLDRTILIFKSSQKKSLTSVMTASIDTRNASITSTFETETPTVILEKALRTLALALAALHRAGPSYTRKSQPFWFFVAGSWPNEEYQFRILEQMKQLPKRISVLHDVLFAEETVMKAILLLRKYGDDRDAEDLAEALGAFLRSIEGGW